MPKVAATKSAFAPMDRAVKRAVNKQVNAAICQLQLADEYVHDQEPTKARAAFKTAREAIEEGVRLLKAQ